MTDRDSRPPLGQSPRQTDPEGDPDFAEEHDNTAVSDEITSRRDTEREPESPEGWSGLEPDPPTAN